jgi:Predicted AAA-ATPase
MTSFHLSWRCMSPAFRFTPLLSHSHTRIPVLRSSSNSRPSSKLVVSGQLEKFPLGYSDFCEVRQLPGLAYFDKTEYIPVLERGSKVQLVCRPRRFGKSLTVSMLRYFHGFEFRSLYNQLFKVCGCGISAHITYAIIRISM